MAKLKADVVLTVVLADGEGFRKGTTKAKLLAESQSFFEDGFTKQAWIDRMVELYEQGGIFAESMIVENHNTETWAKAWWNEFYTKHGVFQILADVQDS